MRLAQAQIVDAVSLADRVAAGFAAPLAETSDGCTIELLGKIPTKKNERIGTGRSARYRPDVKAQIKALVDLTAIQWGKRPPVRHPNLEIQIQTDNASQDLDGMETTLIDVLKKAGVIVDDRIKDFNGMKVVRPATIGTPKCTLRLDWRV